MKKNSEISDADKLDFLNPDNLSKEKKFKLLVKYGVIDRLDKHESKLYAGLSKVYVINRKSIEDDNCNLPFDCIRIGDKLYSSFITYFEDLLISAFVKSNSKIFGLKKRRKEGATLIVSNSDIIYHPKELDGCHDLVEVLSPIADVYSIWKNKGCGDYLLENLDLIELERRPEKWKIHRKRQ